jgi:hypothetical protein
MLGCSWVAVQLAASQEGLRSMSEWEISSSTDLLLFVGLVCSCESQDCLVLYHICYFTFMKTYYLSIDSSTVNLSPTSKFRALAMFVTVQLWTIFHTMCARIFLFYLQEKFCMFNAEGSLVNTTKQISKPNFILNFAYKLCKMAGQEASQ